MRSAICKTLVIISHKYHIKSTNGYEVKGGFQALTNEIASHFNSVSLCVPVNEEIVQGGQPYSDNIEVTPLPKFEGRNELTRKLPAIVPVMWNAIHEADIAYCMGPNYAGVLAMLLAKLQRKKMFASIDTDRARNVLQMDYNRAEKYLKYGVNRFALYPLIRLLCKDVPVFVTGNMFMGHYPAWTQWIKTTLKKKDIPPKEMQTEDSSKSHIVFAGRLSHEKNLLRLIQAIDQLNKSGDAVRCTIVGSGELKGKLEQLAASLDAPVDFAGQIPNEKLIESRFLHADVFVLPSLEERQGKVLLEAMACSIPVVASNTGGIPTVITHNVNGLLCSPRSTTDIALKIRNIIQSNKLKIKLAENGYRYAKEHALDMEISKLMGQVVGHYDLDLKAN